MAAPCTLAALLAALPPASAVLLDPDPAAPPLLAGLPAAGELPWLLVGPEGGFVAAELAAAARAGVAVARLGSTALRVEQAALAAAAQALGMAQASGVAGR
ncbi:MAG: 16S rRNA (uracil(1498)-N(3))-methyltransferase [Planctomycetia bacterium]